MALTYTDVRQSGDGKTDHQSWGPMLQILGRQFTRNFMSIPDGAKPKAQYIDFPTEQIKETALPTAWQDGEEAQIEATDTADRQRNYCQIFQKGFGVGYGAKNTSSGSWRQHA